MATGGPSSRLYRTIWRWHFYAGLFVLPFLITLSLSGSFYLFKPQIERWEERAFHGRAATAVVPPHRQVERALEANPGAVVLDYRLPERMGDAAMIRLAPADAAGVREVFVAPDGQVLGSLSPDGRIMATVKGIHSQLLIGKAGNWLVELAACWAILLILSGLFLWWPRGGGLGGVLWPRLTRGKRLFWRDLHAVTGFWVSALALILLLTGLPWADVWGSAFRMVRAEMGWVKGSSPWAVDEGAARPAEMAHAGHAAHGHAGHAPQETGSFSPAVFDAMVARAGRERLAFPVIVTPPGMPGRFGAPGENGWTIRSDALNVPLQQTIRFDLAGALLSRERFEDSHVIDRVVGYGIAWHQGALFGRLNQAIGVLTALGLVTLATSGFVLWRRRKPEGLLGAPSAAGLRAGPAILGLLLALALLLPLLAVSLVTIWLVERLVFPRAPRLAAWLGVEG